MIKKKDERSFNQLVDYHEGNILKYLLKGDLRGGVFLAIDDASRWSKNKKNG